MSDGLVKMCKRLSKYAHAQLSSADLERIANRIEELEAKLATVRRDALEDRRPCSTDVWMVAAVEQLDDKWDFFEACKAWCEGDWEGAMEGITIRALIAQEEPTT